MKIALDLFPILLFFAAYKFGTIYQATAVLMAATLVQSLLMYRLEGKLATMQKVTLALIVVFGGLTLLLQDERFIKYKPTLLYSCMALGLFFSQLKRNASAVPHLFYKTSGYAMPSSSLPSLLQYQEKTPLQMISPYYSSSSSLVVEYSA